MFEHLDNILSCTVGPYPNQPLSCSVVDTSENVLGEFYAEVFSSNFHHTVWMKGIIFVSFLVFGCVLHVSICGVYV